MFLEKKRTFVQIVTKTKGFGSWIYIFFFLLQISIYKRKFVQIVTETKGFGSGYIFFSFYIYILFFLFFCARFLFINSDKIFFILFIYDRHMYSFLVSSAKIEPTHIYSLKDSRTISILNMGLFKNGTSNFLKQSIFLGAEKYIKSKNI